jgi:Skp family chaperone for outer membrane proteins
METAMNTLHRSLPFRFCVGAATLVMLGACSSVSKTTKEAVARADSRFQQAQQSLGNSEGGAVELQRAKTHLEQAQKAVKDGDDKPALRHAQQSELDVELAVAKAQNASARKAANEMQASIQQLRQETQRPPATTR